MNLLNLLREGYVRTGDFSHRIYKDGEYEEYTVLVLTNEEGENIIYDPKRKQIISTFIVVNKYDEEVELQRIRDYDHS